MVTSSKPDVVIELSNLHNISKSTKPLGFFSLKQKWLSETEKKSLLGVERGQGIKRTISLPSVNRLSK
jgi:hypothetical protein